MFYFNYNFDFKFCLAGECCEDILGLSRVVELQRLFPLIKLYVLVQNGTKWLRVMFECRQFRVLECC